MMDNDDELKELLGSMHQENQFSFDKDNWEKLAAELKEERKNKKRLYFYLTVIGLFIGFTGVYLLNYENKRNAELSFTSNKKTSSLQAVNKKTNTANEDIHGSLRNLNTTTHSSGKTKLESKNPTQNSDDKTKIKPGVPTQNFNEKIKADISLTKKIKPGKPQFTSAPVSPGVVMPSKTKKDFASENVISKEQGSGEETKSTDLADIKKNDLENSPTKEQENMEGSKSTDLLNSYQNNSETSLAKLENQIPENNFIDSVLTPKSIETSGKTNESEPLAKTEPTLTAPKSDSALVTPPSNKDSIKGKPANNILSFEVGSNYLFGWENTNKTEANGFNPLIGFTYYNTITNKIGVSIGVQYTSINNLNGTSHTSTNTRLKFGEESDVTKISANKMYYLVVPLKLSYAINKKNFIAIGYNMGFLLDVKSKVETYTERLDSQTNYQVSTAMGYRSGFNNFDGQVSVSYRRRIYKELFISSELFYGLRDIKDNTIYKSAVFERNCGLKLMLSFNFLKK